jgi:hypothetical protein
MPRARKRSRTTGASRSRRPADGRQRRRPRNAGRKTGSALKYSKWIESPKDHEDRQGQSLATRNHDVIRQWAEARRAVPATVGDTQRGRDTGVLRLNFPGYSERRLQKISWNAWFGTFDDRNLVFLFQEHKRDGSTSNFFKFNRAK